MQAPTGGTTQPPRECGGTCDPNVQRRIHRGPGHDRQQLPIAHAHRAKRVFTYGNPVVDHRPPKEDPNRIRITAGGKLIKCEEEVSVRTADINTAKLLWNSVISTIGARYMCLDIGNFYLTAALE